MATSDLEIYNDYDWAFRRSQENAYMAWASGEPIREAKSDMADPRTGDRAKLYPLGINPIRKVCAVHRSVLIGHVDEPDQPPIQINCIARRPEQRAAAETVEQILRDVWVDSYGGPLQFEAGLLMQIYGGHFFKLAWDPTDTFARYRVRYIGLESPRVHVVYDPNNRWRLKEAYVGYMIDADVARALYHVDIQSKMQVLYLEQWHRDHYRISVNDQVIKNDNGAFLEGENPIGEIPIVYIPHMRDGGFWGKSHIPDLVGLTEEKNAQAANVGDAINEATHPTMVGVNMSSAPSQTVLMRDSGGQVIKTAVNIGKAQNIPNAPQPDVKYVSTTVPKEAVEYGPQLWSEICKQADIASVAIGDDDVSGGRITGPVTAYRMWPTTSHTQAERAEFATGVVLLAKLTLMAMKAAGSDYKQLDLSAPAITDEMLALDVSTTWRPQIPIDRTESEALLNARLQAGGISLETYLRLMGERDVEGEVARIWADREKDAGIQAKVRAQSVPPAGQEGKRANKGQSSSQSS